MSSLLIGEIQIAFIVLMALISVTLVIIIPRVTKQVEIYHHARNLLSVGTLLVTFHFIIQYFIHKIDLSLLDARIVVNLLFGIPASYFFNLSFLYLQRSGKLHKVELFLPLVIYILSFFILICGLLNQTISFYILCIIVAFFYSFISLGFNYLQIKEHLHLIKDCNQKKDIFLIKLKGWMKWCLILSSLCSLLFPIMIFSTSLKWRAIFGVFAIAITFFYCFSFISYGLDAAGNELIISMQRKRMRKTANLRNPDIGELIEEFISKKLYLDSSITFKDVVKSMNIPSCMLYEWLNKNHYANFRDWISSLRIEEAKKLLVEYPGMSNETIARMVGFNSRTYFQSTFRKKVDMSPLEWINMSREANDIESE